MSREKWERVKQIFAAALEIEAGRRRTFLGEACSGDEELRTEVETLLAAHEAAGDFIESPPSEAFHLVENLEPAAPYERLGPYRLLGRIGAGGMGLVYSALRDDDEFHRQVAIKVVSRGMNTEFILRRFRQERQILAGLNHPNITMLLDGGATPDGLPYFVMEFVEGKPILTYCEEKSLALRERLELFRTVCAAVQYAHENRVVHRDLKPSNILVTTDGIPKLLDFGIARIFDPGGGEEAVEHTISTRSLMTPEYASPEQMRGEVGTPASDIYSLGVLLYEMLTRQRPYRVDMMTPQKIAEAVCSQEPEKPSIVVMHLQEDTAKQAASALRNETDLARKLRGDLDGIVLMALRKEPEHRYGTAKELSEDIRRHLEGLPVSAHKGARLYRLGKFLRRNKTAILSAAAALVTVAILVPIVFMLIGALRLAGSGEIVLVSEPPEVEVWLDDRLVGSTRSGGLSLTGLAPGPHRIEARKPGFTSLKEAVTITRGNNPRRRLVLRPAMAVLEIRTDQPGVQILVDGQVRGITRNDGSGIVQDIPPGLHSLLLFKEGFAEWKGERAFSAERTTEIFTTLARWEIDPKLSLLRITSDPPEAQVRVIGADGTRSGIASGGSFTLKNLKPGEITVALEKEGYERKEVRLSLLAGQATTRHIVLPAKPALLDLITAPSVAGAIVKINDKEIGKTSSLGILHVSVSAAKGPALLEIIHDGYEKEMRHVELQPGKSQELKVAMTSRGAAPSTSLLSVSSAPAEAEVSIDQTRVGVTPLSNIRVTPGQHRILVRKNKYRERAETVDLLPGEPRALSYALERELGMLKLEIEPSDVKVTIEGQSYNTASQKEIPLPPGDHTVLLERAGHASKLLKATIVDQSTTVLREKLDSAGPIPAFGEPFSDSFLNMNNWENQAGWRADGVLHAQGAGTALLKGRSFGNFKQRLSLRLINGISASLIIRASDANNFYLIQLNGDSYWNPTLRSTILFLAYREGKAIELASNALPVDPRKMREWFQVFVEARDNNIKVSISGRILSGTTAKEAELGRFKDPDNLHPLGRIGFRTARNEVFDVNGLVVEPLNDSR